MANDRIVSSIQRDLFLSIAELEQNLDTNIKLGLDEHEAKTRLEDQGINVLANRRKECELLKVLKNLIGMHNTPLWIGAALCLAAYLTEIYLGDSKLQVKTDNLYIGLGLIAFVFAFGIFSYYMEAKCEYYLESGREYVSRYSIVIRDGAPISVHREQIVAGDLIILREGDEVCADVKLVECNDVRINVHMLSERERYFFLRIYGRCDRLFHVGEIIFRRSFIFSGHCKAIVIRTRQSYLSDSSISGARIPRDDSIKRHNLNPLTCELNSLLRYLSLIAIAIGTLYGVSSLFFDYSWLKAVMLFIALYVGIITEALLPTFNVAKTQIAKELASKNCYIKNIDSLETLGTTTIICTNKSGVITQKRMIVAKIWIDNHSIASYEFMRDYKNTELKEPFCSFVRTCALCLFAQFSANTESCDLSPLKRTAIGMPLEVAILRYIAAFVGNIDLYQAAHERLLEMSFNSQNKCSLKVYAHVDDKFLICIKGEPESLIYASSLILTGDGLKKFSQSHKSHLLSVCEKLGKDKLRIIGVAQVIIARNDEFFEICGKINTTKFSHILSESDKFEIQFLGLLGLQNPVRLSVPEAIFQCRQAGIKVVMTTADHPATALSIAKTAGIVLHKCPKQQTFDDQEAISLSKFSMVPSSIYTGYEIAKIKDDRLRRIISSCNNLVFARILPEDKLRIVDCFRQCRSLVAVTGVGTSDLPIFDRSHVRISLGQYGSDITKRNSDIVLLNDDFASIVYGIEAGRVLFENIKKYLCYSLSSKPAELYPYALYILLGIPQMASSITILAIDLFTDNLPPIALGYEKAESHVMKR